MDERSECEGHTHPLNSLYSPNQLTFKSEKKFQISVYGDNFCPVSDIIINTLNESFNVDFVPKEMLFCQFFNAFFNILYFMYIGK